MSGLYSIIAKKAIITLGLIGLLFIVFVAPEQASARVAGDPRYSDQAKVWNQINAPAAWDYSVGSRKVVVAVIDAGVDTWHDDLRGNIWVNEEEVPENGLDDDRNGFIDDINGWNFIENNNNVRTSVFDVQDDPEAVRHGTVIAGIIGAVGGNNRDGVGLNWRLRIMPIRAIDSSGYGSFAQVVAAVNYAVENGADIISMSFIGEDPVWSLREALRRAYDQGVVVVTAAGNHSREVSGDLDVQPMYPACFDDSGGANWLLTVAAVDGSDRLSRFSNYGRCVDIAAPGEGIFSTERYAPQFGYNRRFGGDWKGTSFAAPMVAGAAALLAGAHPDWRPDAIISALLATADNIDSVNPGYPGKLGAGRLNAGRALAAADKIEPPGNTLDGPLYYYNKHGLWRRTIKNGAVALVAVVADGEIISAGEVRGKDETEKRLVILFKRGRVNVVRQLSEKGAVVARDFIVPSVPRRLTRSIRAFSTEEGVFPVIEQFDRRSKKTIFAEFDSAGRKLKEIAVASAPASWQVSAASRAVIASMERGGRITVVQLPFDDQDETYRIIVSEARSVMASALGSFWGGEGEQLAMVVLHGGVPALAVVDLASGSYRLDEIAGSADSSPWKLITLKSAEGDSRFLLPFQMDGGVFSVLNGSAAPLKTVAIPLISDKVD